MVYTGTHDNNTTRGWFEAEATPAVRRVLARYLGRSMAANSIVREFIRLALASPAKDAVLPAQDLLGLGAEHRMNTPGLETGNWGWRAPQNALTLCGEGRALAEELRGLCELFGRTQGPGQETPDEA